MLSALCCAVEELVGRFGKKCRFRGALGQLGLLVNDSVCLDVDLLWLFLHGKSLVSLEEHTVFHICVCACGIGFVMNMSLWQFGRGSALADVVLRSYCGNVGPFEFRHTRDGT